MRLLPCGETAVLVEVDRLEDTLALHHHLSQAMPPRVIDLVPAAKTVLVVVDAPDALASVRAMLAAIGPLTAMPNPIPDQTVTVPVSYHGPDLDEVARLTGLTSAEVVEAHTGRDWQVAFGGFAPGFAYLSGGDPRLTVPRRATPRARVPAGSVGLADTFSGIYPSASPGGWQLIGHTSLAVWDQRRDPPSLLTPGTIVRFEVK